MIVCSKCNGRVIVDRIFLYNDHLEVYCLLCGQRKIFHQPEKHGNFARLIMAIEKRRAKEIGWNISYVDGKENKKYAAD